MWRDLVFEVEGPLPDGLEWTDVPIRIVEELATAGNREAQEERARRRVAEEVGIRSAV